MVIRPPFYYTGPVKVPAGRRALSRLQVRLRKVPTPGPAPGTGSRVDSIEV